MTDLERLRQWLQGYPNWEESLQVDFAEVFLAFEELIHHAKQKQILLPKKQKKHKQKKQL